MAGLQEKPPALLSTPPRPGNKRAWASLTKGKAAVIDEVIAGMRRRDPAGSKTRFALTDGEPALPDPGRSKARRYPCCD